MEKKSKDKESNFKSIIISALASLISALISRFLANDKDNNTPLIVFSVSLVSLLVITLSVNLTWVKINKKLTKIWKNVSVQKAGRDINNYYVPFNKDITTSPETVENKERGQGKEITKEEIIVKHNLEKNRDQPKKEQEISQEEFDRLLVKIKFIAFGIMGNIKWDKVEPLKFRRGKEGKETALLMFEVEGKGCFIELIVSEESKRELQKKSVYEIVESFIIQRLVNYGINNYFDYHCPDCKQTTLTKSLIANSPSREEAICCNLCRWAISMKAYLEYLDYKSRNPSLKFYEWLDEHNRRG